MALEAAIAVQRQVEIRNSLRDPLLRRAALSLANHTDALYCDVNSRHSKERLKEALWHSDVNLLTAAAFTLKSATPFYWQKDAMTLARAASRKLPDDYCLAATDLMVDDGFFWFSRPYSEIDLRLTDTLAEKEGVEKISDVAFGWHKAGGDLLFLVSFSVIRFRDGHEAPPIPTRLGILTLGRANTNTFEKAYGSGRSSRGSIVAVERAKFEVSSIIFAGQKVLKTTSQLTPKAMRADKDCTIAGEYKIVTLRRHHYETIERNSGASSGIDWAFQWVVRGHWRNQFYPSTDSHGTIWIDPYIKGPENKPLKDSTVIFHVSR